MSHRCTDGVSVVIGQLLFVQLLILSSSALMIYDAVADGS